MRSTLISLALVATFALVSALPSNTNADVVRRDTTLAKKSTAGAIYRRALNREVSRVVRRDENEDENEEEEDDKGDEDEEESSSHERRDIDEILEGIFDS
ncbi:hypothetical protein BCV72DRAFT_306850 [Rhizopus microsporus var. microsporus]|uniref:RxLR effector protein n=2 Tax=Rhizopus microsporus TaxID=58291 RepID=A0A2G4SNX1_RHIZD|nr:uncharacterized protein RHIMIDRAFT_260866 [Rhizopus microsporus ATCC 52813]ORE04947.1 hypothetical protein BCV72DRAFT_306850 [Rhizopus microsporus var. microsporus]PHZ10460.1 hypothetical protein RHIMIDRAFT_260866 [Rhizopus microsporus ATCC 52813]